MTTSARDAGTFTVVIPCAAEKRPGTHPARDLYDSPNFRLTLAAAEALADGEGGQVLILSALYGLVAPDETITAYDVKIGTGHECEITAEEVAAQLVEADATGDVHVMAPRAYFAKVDAAARLIGALAFDLYEGEGGIGDQRRVAATVRDTYTDAPAWVTRDLDLAA